MFTDAQQVFQAVQATHPEKQKDPVRELVQFGAAFVLGRSVAKVIKKHQWPAR